MDDVAYLDTAISSRGHRRVAVEVSDQSLVDKYGMLSIRTLSQKMIDGSWRTYHERVIHMNKARFLRQFVRLSDDNGRDV